MSQELKQVCFCMTSNPARSGSKIPREIGLGWLFAWAALLPRDSFPPMLFLNCSSSLLEKRELKPCKESKFLESSLEACPMYSVYNRNESCK